MIDYDKFSAVNYAKEWAYRRNPKYFNFDRLGGDCTNFVSQCIFSGTDTMNFTPITGWYYKSLNDRAPAWTGVNELFSFLINNKGFGPIGEIIPFSSVNIGDIVQLYSNQKGYFHCAIVSEVTPFGVYVCSHTRDALNYPLIYFYYESLRFVRIIGVNVK
jgi:hypothetical protein